MSADIATRLAETIAWCSLHVRAEDADGSTRSAALCPPVMKLAGLEALERLLNRPGEAKAAVEWVCEARRRELARSGIPVPPVRADLSGGRVLFTTIDTDSCAAASESSYGYYDGNDLPGWDTWFHHEATATTWGAIYCWAPACLLELARKGMEVIPVMSVQWAEGGFGRF